MGAPRTSCRLIRCRRPRSAANAGSVMLRVEGRGSTQSQTSLEGLVAPLRKRPSPNSLLIFIIFRSAILRLLGNGKQISGCVFGHVVISFDERNIRRYQLITVTIFRQVILGCQSAPSYMQGGPKKRGDRLMTTILSNFNRFTKILHWKIP